MTVAKPDGEAFRMNGGRVNSQELDMVADMEVDKVADMEVDKVADMLANNKKRSTSTLTLTSNLVR